MMEAISRLRQGILDQPVDLWCVAGAARRLRPAALTAGAAFAQGLASRQPPAPRHAARRDRQLPPHHDPVRSPRPRWHGRSARPLTGRALFRYLYHFEYQKTLLPLFYRDGTGLG